ncbi:hypothetical protein [Vallitalea okinawensis]|uniref:hypothetical protein n=1 Tax=Vallitalea okinawensis TaxID=2078660 RepID=UPI00130026FC|nr:hypothetical protein [Vallitalea okinawensis]
MLKMLEPNWNVVLPYMSRSICKKCKRQEYGYCNVHKGKFLHVAEWECKYFQEKQVAK